MPAWRAPYSVRRTALLIASVGSKGAVERVSLVSNEVAQVLDDAARGLDLVGYAIELASHELRIGSIAALTGLCQLVARRFAGEVDHLQRLADLVRHGARHLAHRGKKRSASFSACSASRRSVSSTPTKTTLVVLPSASTTGAAVTEMLRRGPADPSGAG